MWRRFPPLNPLRAFEVTARHLSFTKAADELYVTQGAVSRQVKSLEIYLGFPLFNRGPRGLELTQQAKTYAAALTDSFQRVENATDEIFTKHRLTRITIKGYTTLLNRWLIPLLAEFQLANPDIMVRTIASSENVDFSRDVVDIGICYGTGHWGDMVAELLFRDSLTPVCSPAYLEQVGGLKSVEDLSGCLLLHLRKRRRDWPDWLIDSGGADIVDDEGMVFEELAILYEAALGGQGIAMGQLQYLVEDLRSGRLVRPFGHVLHRKAGYYLVIPEGRTASQKVINFREWIMSKRPAGDKAA